MKTRKSLVILISIVIFLGLPCTLAWFEVSAVVSFLLALAVLAFVLGQIGKQLSSRWVAVLIDPARKRYSLARFQVVLWTWIVFSALYVLFVYRVFGSAPEPLNIVIPEMILVILGISLTTSVGAPLIEKEKADRTEETVPAPQGGQPLAFNPAAKSYHNTLAQTQAAKAGPATTGDVRNRGVIVYNDGIEQATFLDIFQGVEVGDYHLVDISKVQNFLITVILAVAYLVMLITDFETMTTLMGAEVSLPEFSGYAVTLLAISHAAYLTSKSFTKSTRS